MRVADVGLRKEPTGCPIGFHADVKVGTLPLERVRAYGDPDVLFFNVNTPADLERAEAVWQQRG